MDDKASRDVRFQVEEVFEGLSPSVREVVVEVWDSWLIKGQRYLIDAGKGNDNRLQLMTCGNSAEVTYEGIADVIKFLRQRAKGKTKTSLGVGVTDRYKPVPNVAVTIQGPQGQLTARTGVDGAATFSNIKPARYSVSAVLAHYQPDPGAHSDESVDVVAGACSGAHIGIHSDAKVSGQVFDSKGVPVALLRLELLTDPGDPAGAISLNKSFFETTTDASGRFVLNGVSPGRYLLGSNIIGGHTSSVPPTYYPGQRSRNGAYPIQVNLGEAVSNLRFTLPDFGTQREIHVCVVDENGTPVPSANVVSDYGTKGTDFAELQTKLSTDETGCGSANGYTGAKYLISAVLRPAGADIWQILGSDSFRIDPGEEPVHAVFVLHKPLGSSRPKQ
jgi:hypothetical protein